MIILPEKTIENMPDKHTLRSLQTSLNRYCLSLTGSSWDAEDLAQDSWIKALRVMQVTGSLNPEALLLRIAKNTWIDGTRRKAVFNRVVEHLKSKEAPSLESSPVEIEIIMQSLIKHLSPLQRTVFLMRDVLGYTAAEAAEKLKTTEGAVKAALFRARQTLQPVREDLEAGGPSIPNDEGRQHLLESLADAYVHGHITELLKLALQEEHSGTIAIGRMQHNPDRSSIKAPMYVQTQMRMSA